MRRGQPSRVVDAVGPASLVEEIVRLLVLSVLGVEGGVRRHLVVFLSLAFDVMKQRKADMAYRSRAHRHPAHSPHTRRPRARPTPAGRKGSDRLGWQQNEYVEREIFSNTKQL